MSLKISIILNILPSNLERASSCTEYMKNPAKEREAMVLKSIERGELFMIVTYSLFSMNYHLNHYFHI